MINNSLLLRTAGKYPSIQVRERSAWVRDFPDVPRSILDASAIPDWWKAGNLCPRNSHRHGSRSTARKSSRALPVHHEGDPRVLLKVEAQRVGRPTPSAKRHRYVSGVGALRDGEARAAAPLRGIHNYSATTMRHKTHHVIRSRQRA